LHISVQCEKKYPPPKSDINFIIPNENIFLFLYSLNREKRQRELLRLTRENQSILGRITQRKPEYSADSWAKQWEEDQKFMDNISHFPKNWWLMKVRGLID
jgi:hypothetical protein